MSAGLLARLAGRALGVESGLRPVIRPLFAPGAILAQTVEEVPAPAATSPERAIEASLPSRPPVIEAKAAPEPPARQERLLVPVPPDHDPSLRPAHHPPTPPVNRPEPPAIRRRQPSEVQDEPRPAVTPAATQTRRADPGSPQLSATLLPTVAPATETISQPLQPEPLLLPPQVHAAMVFPAAPPVRQVPPGNPNSEPQAPPVKISIGRIEVRAESPAPRAAPPPSHEPHPAMSLDEYLRRLNEEHR